jgi:hypothetical protein
MRPRATLSLPDLIRQSMQRFGRMDARVKPGHDEQKGKACSTAFPSV